MLDSSLKDQEIKNIKIYDQYAENFNDKIGKLKNYNITYDKLLEYLPEKAHCLDLGCGPGNVSYYLHKKRKTLKFTLVDLSLNMLKIARKNLPFEIYVNEDIRNIKYKESSFDCIILAFTLPYLTEKDIKKVFKNINFILKPKGVCYISFMTGKESGYEKTTFSENNEIYINYHSYDFILKIINNYNLTILREFTLDYSETDGSITKDKILIIKKELFI